MKGTAMKIEIEKDFPQYFRPAYPEEFELFHHFEGGRKIFCVYGENLL